MLSNSYKTLQRRAANAGSISVASNFVGRILDVACWSNSGIEQKAARMGGPWKSITHNRVGRDIQAPVS